MSQERRRHTRLAVRIDEMDGFFRLNLNGEWHPLNEVKDVSISGMGLCLTAAIPPGTILQVGYMSRDLEITLPATVRWCRDHAPSEEGAPASYYVGIEFQSKKIDDNMLMFMAIRKFLDPFT